MHLAAGAFDMNTIGFDYGKRAIGVAIGQTDTYQAQALTVVRAKKGVPDWPHIDKLIQQWRPDALVVGLPLNMDGSSQNLTKACMVFKSHLEERYQLPVHLVDERLSSYEARQNTPTITASSSAIDAESARIILQDWLDNFS